jgi:hypothetical protein
MRRQAFFVVVAVMALVGSAAASAQVGGTAFARFRGFDEVPALSTPGGGSFSATISEDGSQLDYELNYFNLEGVVTQSHVHFAQRGVNGGISFFLCSNLGNGPVGTQACPPAPATLHGTVHAADVIGPTGQSLGAGELFAILRAMRAGIAYANVHTTLFPGGEIRGQVLFTPAP